MLPLPRWDLKIPMTMGILIRLMAPMTSTIPANPRRSVSMPPTDCPPAVPMLTNIIKIANMDAEICGSLKSMATTP